VPLKRNKMSGDNEARNQAMVEFINCFPTLSIAPATVADLDDGVALFECLAEIAPTFFDPTTIARHLGDNWALKSSNLRKLIRNLETYYHVELHKNANFSTVSVSDISRNSDPESIASLFELIIAAAVKCENKGVFVQRIMTLSHASQMEMKNIVISCESRLEDFAGEQDVGTDFSDDEEDSDNEKELVFGSNFDSSSMDELMIDTDAGGMLFPGSGMGDNNEEFLEAIKERDELKKSLADARRDLAGLKNDQVYGAEELEGTNKKLRTLASDLQERLSKSQSELSAVEENLTKTKRQLEDASAAADEMREKNDGLADELDVANSKALQLRKSEALIQTYRKKLQSVGVITQQMNELEDQSATYLRQILDLEVENKQIPTLQKRIDSLQKDKAKIEKQARESEENLKEKIADVARLKSKVGAAESAKKIYLDEIEDLKAQQEDNDLENDPMIPGLGLTPAKSLREAKEKVIRLEHENANLKKQVAEALSNPVLSADSGTSRGNGNVTKLKEELKRKDAQIAKVSSDKEKLEAYTKKTLSKFQEKYLVALQECKAKLKEKHDKIEQLEMRSASEKTAQKREERLLSSTIYELGLAIMQNRLTKR